MKRIARERPLTAKEVERDKKVRDLIEQEKPEINARIRRRMAKARQAKAPDRRDRAASVPSPSGRGFSIGQPLTSSTIS